MTEDAVQGLTGQIVFSKLYPAYETYVAAFRKGLSTIRENGTYHTLFERYYGKGNVPSVVYELDRKEWHLQ